MPFTAKYTPDTAVSSLLDAVNVTRPETVLLAVGLKNVTNGALVSAGVPEPEIYIDTSSIASTPTELIKWKNVTLTAPTGGTKVFCTGVHVATGCNSLISPK